jgi:hypothetical protein
MDVEVAYCFKLKRFLPQIFHFLALHSLTSGRTLSISICLTQVHIGQSLCSVKANAPTANSC